MHRYKKTLANIFSAAEQTEFIRLSPTAVGKEIKWRRKGRGSHRDERRKSGSKEEGMN